VIVWLAALSAISGRSVARSIVGAEVRAWLAEPWFLPMMGTELGLELAHFIELRGRELGA
jgi:hypothetical protein